ncbi:hypothetical protein ACFL3T_03565 [Patescibacteria group bacterium]
MLNKIIIIIITLALSSLLAFFQYDYFSVNSGLAFTILNVVAFIFGLFFMYSAYVLLKKYPKLKWILYLNAVMGFVMIVIHIQKLVVGVCI